MKKLLAVFAVAAFAVVGVAVTGLGAPAQAKNAPTCDVAVVGPRGGAFKMNGRNATVQFKVTGQNGCTIGMMAWANYAPTANGRPYDKQIRYDTVRKTFGKGTHQLTVQIPAAGSKTKGCFYQVDLDTYPRKGQVMAFGHGKLPCGEKPTPPTPPPAPKKVQVCDIATRKTITVNESEKNNPKYAPVGSEKCKKQVEVCDRVTKQHVVVNEGYDMERYTINFTECEDTPPVTPPTPPTPPTPEEPPVETPEELPETGPVQAIAQFLGAGSMVASAGYYLQSRRS